MPAVGLDGTRSQPGAFLPTPIDLEQLLIRVAAGDARAFGEVYDRTAPYVFGLLRRMLATAEQAEEVAQEVYLQVWRAAGAFDPDRATAWTWLAMMARSRAVDRMRGDVSYRGALDSLARDAEAEPAGGRGGPATGPGENPEHHAVLAERGALVRSALTELPSEQAEALWLAFFGGLSHREIAERTETPLGTVKTRIRTAMLRLRDRLAPILSSGDDR